MTLRYYVQALWFTTVVEAGVRCVSVRRLASWLGVATAPHESQATAPCASVEDAVRAADRVLGTTGRAICVSPGTVEPFNDADINAASGPYACPTTFRPPLRRGIFPRLAFHFSIGEAF